MLLCDIFLGYLSDSLFIYITNDHSVTNVMVAATETSTACCFLIII